MTEESFSLTIAYKGSEIEVPGMLRVSAYAQQFIFQVNGLELVVERDNEQNLRALLPSAEMEKGKSIDLSLVAAIVSELEKVLNN